MRKKDGFVLVVALVVLGALAMLAVSATFLSTANATTSGNLQRQAAVRFQAETGIDLALARLSANFSKWPSWCSTSGTNCIPAPTDMSFTVSIKNLDSTNAGICVGSGASAVCSFNTLPVLVTATSTSGNTEYVASVIVKPNYSNEVDPVFGYGLVTQGSVDVPSNSMVQTNIWSGGSVTGGGSPYFKYIASTDSENSGQPYWGRSTNTTCGVFDPTTSNTAASTKTQCLTNQPMPTVPIPSFTGQRSDLMTEAGVTQASNGTYSGCTHTLSGTVNNISSVVANLSTLSIKKVICLAANTTLTIPSGVFLKNTYIIGDTTTTVNVNGGTGPLATGESNNRLGMKIVSNTVNIDQCNQSSCTNDTLTGINTFVARTNMNYKKAASSPDLVSRTFVVVTGDSASPSTYPGNVTISGVSGQTVNASFWVRGQATLNGAGGSLQFVGTVVSGMMTSTGGYSSSSNGINFNGSAAYVQRPPGVENEQIPRNPSSSNLTISGRK
ncbi:hypothetical protein [Deinococcus yavapaiensis]|uniref:Type 4 fimbrial biogenesis protein PilX N-terminal domain-containing protein n=1 Tax=Deinococcus yavapaiensis KR-236 TaxID=694435 RepID=A0A318SM15_9DEIO|nr:hypothetical protein [Deinococcus yavapaiensis]PYE53570.1 hypothetical protein DES52_10899 [Deinococcus yavapaiensis KR-236]